MKVILERMQKVEKTYLIQGETPSQFDYVCPAFSIETSTSQENSKTWEN